MLLVEFGCEVCWLRFSTKQTGKLHHMHLLHHASRGDATAASCQQRRCNSCIMLAEQMQQLHKPRSGDGTAASCQQRRCNSCIMPAEEIEQLHHASRGDRTAASCQRRRCNSSIKPAEQMQKLHHANRGDATAASCQQKRCMFCFMQSRCNLFPWNILKLVQSLVGKLPRICTFC